MSINMNLIPHNRLTNLFMLSFSAFALRLCSCNKSGENTVLTGETVVKINLSGVEAYTLKRTTMQFKSKHLQTLHPHQSMHLMHRKCQYRLKTVVLSTWS